MWVLPRWDHQIEPTQWDPDGFVDGLERDALATRLAESLLRLRTGVVGLYGSWGSGKSFVLSLTIKALFAYDRSDPAAVRPLVCLFQPWRYEPDTSLTPGLIRAMETLPDQFQHPDGRGNPLFGKGARAKLHKIGGTLRQLIRSAVGWIPGLMVEVLASASDVAGLVPVGTVVSVAGRAGQRALSKERSDGDAREEAPEEFRTQMQRLVDALRKEAARAEGRPEDSYRVVVVIDDLDRCSPDLLVDMLNWLKTHLTVEHCSYLLALDHGAAARAIVGRYKNYLGDQAEMAYGYRYLEKIVDHEVELSPSPKVEGMASIAATGNAYPSVTEIIEGCLDRQGVRSAEIERLMSLPTLQSPRTMLKVIYRFNGALQEVERGERRKVAVERDGGKHKEHLPSDYPFWLLFFAAMYYRLPPTTIELFCEDRGPLAAREEPALGDEERDNEAVRDFKRFLWSFAPAGEAPLQALPSRVARRELYAAVRRG